MSVSLYSTTRTKAITASVSHPRANHKEESKVTIGLDLPPPNDLDDQSGERAEEHANFKTTRIELVDITEKSKAYGDQPSVYLTSKLYQAKENRGKYDDFALLLRRKIDKEGDALSTTLEIQSPILRYALQHILASYSYLNLAASPIVIKKPYDALFHYRKEIRNYTAAPHRTEEEKQHLAVLLDFMKLNLDATERLYEQMVPKGMITFDLLWTLFRAEEDIILQNEHYQECLRMIHCETRFIDGEKFLEIEAWRWGYNGSKFGPSLEKILIPSFSSSRRITQLKVFPLNATVMRQQKERDLIRSYLIERGKRWRNLVDVCHRQYNGPMWVNPGFDKVHKIDELIINYENTKLILDHDRHQQDNYSLATSLIGANGFVQPKTTRRYSLNDSTDWLRSSYKPVMDPMWNKGMLSQMQCHENTPNYEITDEQALLCPARVRGFSLKSKRWAFVLIDEIEEVQWSENSFDKLEIDPQMKETIEALVLNYGTPNMQFDDFVSDKGKGLVLLLYGPPGAGKTLTAESIAETTHRPLYHIGTGELGTDVTYTEPTLRMIFDRAKAWDAILLLDEADLFLSKRTRDDIRRNAFVTIFLRLLEYYQGILFLTTNRVEEFDPAFKSRIHLSVEYFPLDDSKRASIWRNLLDQIEDCRSWDQATFERLGRDFELNGREIKNLIKPALAIAAHRKMLLTEDVLRLVYRINYGNQSLMKEGS